MHVPIVDDGIDYTREFDAEGNATGFKLQVKPGYEVVSIEFSEDGKQLMKIITEPLPEGWECWPDDAEDPDDPETS